MQNLIATTFEVVHYIALQAVHYKPLQEVHLSRYNQCAMDGLTADLSLMEIPKGQMRFSLQAADRESELFDYMFGNFYGSGSTSHY